MKHRTSRKADVKKSVTGMPTPASPFAGRPMDGSQYVDVVEEQEYADRRPTAEEQRPRFSYMKPQKN